jgi:hypothetical protein
VPASVVISALFEDEPRFANRDDAPALYGNLFGLWDMLESGAQVDLSSPEKPTNRPKKPKPPPAPTRFPKEGPTAEWLEGAFGYLEACPKSERTKLEHAFENRLDALLTWLDESGSGDAVYAAARQILFELFAMLELGAGVGRVSLDSGASSEASADHDSEVPSALSAWAHEAIFQAATDDDEALSPDEAKELERLVNTGLRALWTGVKHGAQRARR